MRTLLTLSITAVTLLLSDQVRSAAGNNLIVFVDTSGSISDAAFENTEKLLNQLVRGWRGHVTIYPIDLNSGSANPAYDGPGLSGHKRDVKLVRDYAAARQILEDEHARALGSKVAESCIINSFELLGQKAANSADPVQVVYLSDMFEECGSTPAQQAIVLQRVETAHPTPNLSRVQQMAQFDAAERAVGHIPLKPDYLKMCHLTLIVPGDVQESAWQDLHRFWKAVLTRYGYPNVGELELQRNNIPSSLNLKP